MTYIAYALYPTPDSVLAGVGHRIRYAEVDDESGDRAVYKLNLPPRVLRRSDLAREACRLPADAFDATYGGTYTLPEPA